MYLLRHKLIKNLNISKRNDYSRMGNLKFLTETVSYVTLYRWSRFAPPPANCGKSPSDSERHVGFLTDDRAFDDTGAPTSIVVFKQPFFYLDPDFA